LHTRESSPPRVMSKMTAVKVVDARVHADHVAGWNLAPERAVAIRLKSTPARDRVVEASATADREVGPQFQTLVLIEATQFGTADSLVWQVQVLRVTLVTQVRERSARVPVANSI
jgi:hypothetical protein